MLYKIIFHDYLSIYYIEHSNSVKCILRAYRIQLKTFQGHNHELS